MSHASQRVELHLHLPYKKQPREHPTVLRMLEHGYRIEHLQRLTDAEAILILRREGPEGAPRPDNPAA